jgi:hypothetical protein
MSQNMSITALTILIIAAGLYFMYGKPYSTPQVDLAAYQALCNKYRAAQPGVYKKDEMQMLVSEIDYLITDDVKDIADPAKKKLKECAQQLSTKLN